MATNSPLTVLQGALGRALRSDFGRDNASEEERATLAAAPTPVTAPLAQDYAVWRSSVLIVASVLLVLVSLIQILSFETISDGMVRQQASQGFADEDAVRANLEQNFGAGNLDLLDMIPILHLLGSLAVVVLAVLAARAWRDPKRSSRLARRGWYFLVGTPLLLATIPWARLLDFGHFDPQQAQAVTSMLGVTMGLTFFMMLAPKVISIFPGIIRASVTLKTMLHESPVPGYTVVLFAPVYAMFVLIVFTTINQMQGNWTLLVGLACLILSPLVYVLRARDFLRSHSAEESVTLVRGVRRQSYLFNLAGIVILVLFLADLEGVSFLQVLEILLAAGGGVFLMMVVAADLVPPVLRLEFLQAKDFHGSDMAQEYEAKLQALSGGVEEAPSAASEPPAAPPSS